MAAPTIAAEALDGSAADAGSHVLDLPAGVGAGDLLVAVVVVDQAPAVTWPSGWTPLVALSNGFIVRVEVRVRVADGSEGATITLTTDSEQMLRSWIFRVAAAEWEGTLGGGVFGAIASGTSTDPDAPDLAPGVGALDFLWIAGWGNDNGNRTFSDTYPASYTDGAFSPIVDAFGVGFGRARRALNASSENPGTASSLSASEEWIGFTLAIAPAADAGDVLLAAAIASSATVAGALAVEKPLAAELSSSSAVAGELAVEKPLAATLASSARLLAALEVGASDVVRRVRMLLGVGP